MPIDKRSSFIALIMVALLAQPSRGTWSIILMDTQTHEIAIGSATCLAGFDLERELPVVITDVGAACAQSRVDVGAVNRMKIHAGYLNGLRPIDILAILEKTDSAHQSRQYGLITANGRRLTFTGTNANDFASGVIGQSGSLVYAIQGNVLTGSPVIELAELAVLNTAGDLPEKLMAGMEAARSMGGDGRCSCPLPVPTDCGSPPAVFTKSAHVGFMIVTRTGDLDGPCTSKFGCAAGDYFMNFNIANQQVEDPDPVLQMQTLFNAWRSSLIGQPDAIQSSTTLEPSMLPADDLGVATLSITLRDWTGAIVDDPALSVTVIHSDDSDLTSQIDPVINDGGGFYHTLIHGGSRMGIDHFLVKVVGADRPVVLLPHPKLLSFAPADFDHDIDIDLDDHATMVTCLTGPALPTTLICSSTDLDGNGVTDLLDIQPFQTQFSDARCVELFIDEQPQPVTTRCSRSFTLSVIVTADPPATFQWFLNSEPIPDATESSYHVASTFNVDLGSYFVEVKNTCRTMVSHTIDVSTFSPPCP